VRKSAKFGLQIFATEASAGVTASLYARHRPERTLLYQLVEDDYPALKAQLAVLLVDEVFSQTIGAPVGDELRVPAALFVCQSSNNHGAGAWH